MASTPIMNRNVFVLSLAFMTFVGACSKNNSPGSGSVGSSGTARIGSMSITDAKQLFVTGENTQGLLLAGDASLKPKTLYKITEAGVVQEVTYTDQDGQEVTVAYQPTEISSPDSRMVIFQFPDGSSYLVRRDDGKAYLVSDSSITGISGPVKNIQKDRTGDTSNLYFWGIQGQAVVRGYFENGNLVKTVMSASGDSVVNYATDSKGNMVYSVYSYDGSDYKMRSFNGTFSKLTNVSAVWTTAAGNLISAGDDGKTFINRTSGETLKDASSIENQLLGSSQFGVGFDFAKISNSSENFKVCIGVDQTWCSQEDDYYTPAGDTEAIIAQINAINSKFQIRSVSDKYLQISGPTNTSWYFQYGTNGVFSSGYPMSMDFNSSSTINGETLPFLCRSKNLIFQFIRAGEVMTLTNEDDLTMNAYEFLGNSQVVCLDDYIYAVSEDESIYRFDVANKIGQKFEIEGVLDISSFSVASTSSISVQGRLTDGSSFFGTVDGEGKLTVISKIATGQISIIAPLN